MGNAGAEDQRTLLTLVCSSWAFCCGWSWWQNVSCYLAITFSSQIRFHILFFSTIFHRCTTMQFCIPFDIKAEPLRMALSQSQDSRGRTCSDSEEALCVGFGSYTVTFCVTTSLWTMFYSYFLLEKKKKFFFKAIKLLTNNQKWPRELRGGRWAPNFLSKYERICICDENEGIKLRPQRGSVTLGWFFLVFFLFFFFSFFKKHWLWSVILNLRQWVRNSNSRQSCLLHLNPNLS